jgi:hypothetical protein
MISKSPDRHTFQRDNYIERQKEAGTLDSPETQAIIKMYESFNQTDLANESNPEWRKNNMEYDLRTTDWILEKVRSDDVYAQHLYASMCNNEFTKNETWPRLQDERWSCSWRHAGGIIADMQEKGDYVDWYCSGIRNDLDDDQYRQLDREEQEQFLKIKAYVPESQVTDEVRNDLFKLGWLVVEDPYTD